MATSRDAADRARPGQRHRGRHRGQRAPDRRVDRPRARAPARSSWSSPSRPITGYPAEDLWLKPHFLEAARRALERARAPASRGSSRWSAFPSATPRTYNSVAVLADGGIRARTGSSCCPTTASSTSAATSSRATRPALIEVGGVRVGLTICEDIWYPGPPASVEALAGASLIVNPSASPYHRGKGAAREEMVRGPRPRDRRRVRPLQPRRRAGRARLRRPQRRRLPGGETLARAAQFAEELWSATSRLAPNPRTRAAAHPSGAGRSLRLEVAAPPPRGGASRRSPSCWTPTPRSTRR